MKNTLRDLLADGLLFALPLGAAAYLLHSAIGLLSKLLAPAQRLLPEGRWFGIAAVELAAFVALLLILLLLGAFARSAPGRRVAGAIENVVLSKFPFYQVLRNIAADLSGAEVDSGLRPALVAFDDNSVLGFIVEESADAATVTVFVPGAPGAASGSVVLVPRARVRVLDAPTSRAMRAMKQRGLGLQGLTHAPPPAGAPDRPASGVRKQTEEHVGHSG